MKHDQSHPDNPMMYYRIATRYPKAEIEPIEVQRETEHCVWIAGRRERKKSYWRELYPTWDEAHDALVAKAHSQFKALSIKLRDAAALCRQAEEMIA